MQQAANSIQSLRRAFGILEALSAHPRGVALTDLAAEVKLSKSTVHRFLVSLGEIGYIAKEESTGRYRLTLRMFEVGSKAVHALGILEIARPYLEHIAEATAETVHLVAQDGSKVVYLYKYNPASTTVHMASGIGNCSPMYCTGVGKAILASLPEKEIREVWETSNVRRFTENTITDFDGMMEELEKTRRRGYAVDSEEHERGVFCIAAPILDYSGRPRYAISISAPSVRVSDRHQQEFVRLVQHAASEISALLGMNFASFGLLIPDGGPRVAPE
ncbi:MAG: IclR family transcriptional regulator [Clostridiales bacterium]|nr:IclR family transcriptional regulator [Clostridiales bacterium]